MLQPSQKTPGRFAAVARPAPTYGVCQRLDLAQTLNFLSRSASDMAERVMLRAIRRAEAPRRPAISALAIITQYVGATGLVAVMQRDRQFLHRGPSLAIRNTLVIIAS